MKKYSFVLYRDCFGNISTDSKQVKKTPTIRDYLAKTNPEKLAEVCGKGARKRRTYFYRVGKSAGYAEAIANAPTVAPEKIGTFVCNVDGRFKEWQARLAVVEAVKSGRREAFIVPRSEECNLAHLKKIYVFQFSKEERGKK